MKIKTKKGVPHFEADATELRHVDTVTGMATTVSVLAAGDKQQKAKEAIKAIAAFMDSLKAKEPETPEEAAHADAETAVKEQTVVVVTP